MFRSQILSLVSDWASYHSMRTTDRSHPIHKLIHDALPSDLKGWTADSERYKFQGSDGHGNILSAPWVAVFNRNITENATKGYYLVYLLSEDLKRLVLAVSFGATQFQRRYGRGRKIYHALDAAVASMRLNSAHLGKASLSQSLTRTNVDPVRLDSSGVFLLKAYEHCAIYSLTYEIENLPAEGDLKADYREYLSLYDGMAESLLLADADDYVLETIEPIKPDTEIEVQPFKIREKAKSIKSSSDFKSDGSYRRSKKSDKIGRLGEEFIFKREKKALTEAGFPELAEKVIFHREDATHRTPGWDITSYFEDGRPKYIEVKSSEGKDINAIILTRNEWNKANSPEFANDYFIYLVTNITGAPKIEILENPANFVSQESLKLEVDSYSLSLRKF